MSYKLLVNAPCGDQKIELVSLTGRYFDPARVLWDERIDGRLPDNIELGKMARIDDELVAGEEFTLEYAEMKQISDQSDIAKKTADLWGAADKYIYNTINGVALSILALGVSRSKPKALAVSAWCDAVWAEYYARKSAIAADLEPNLDFSALGDKPYTVLELREEVSYLWAAE